MNMQAKMSLGAIVVLGLVAAMSLSSNGTGDASVESPERRPVSFSPDGSAALAAPGASQEPLDRDEASSHTSDPSASVSVASSDRTDRVVVRVVDENGARVACTIEVDGRGPERRRDHRAHGDPPVFDLTPGDYDLQVDPETLPTWYLPPQPQSQGHHSSLDYGHAREFEVKGGQTQEITLTVWRANTLKGTVLDEAGVGQQHVVVRAEGTFRHQGMSDHMSRDAITDENGNYTLRVYPGKWSVFPFVNYKQEYADLSPINHSLVGIQVPMPRVMTLAGGEAVYHDIHYVSGTCEVIGRVLDQFGEPFAGIAAWLCPSGYSFGVVVQRTSTDELGRFSISGVSPGEYYVKITDRATPLYKTAEGLAYWVDSIDVTLDLEEATVDMGDFLAVRAVEMEATGTVRSDQPLPRGLSFEVIVPNGWKKRYGFEPLSILGVVGEAGEFAWKAPVCLGGIGRIELRFRGRTEGWDFQLEPTPPGLPYHFLLDW